MLKMASALGLLTMIATALALYRIGALISPQPMMLMLQVLAIALMIWARATLGLRSFHALANPTAGGLVMRGPYRYIRHPIYSAACLFVSAGVVTHRSAPSLALGVVFLGGAVVRTLCEERLLARSYPEYLEYRKRTKRMLPYVF
jgi:protein-S-isoprenylcysteine O-methyltransferase Ste14